VYSIAMFVNQGYIVIEDLFTEYEVKFARQLVGTLVDRYRRGEKDVQTSSVSIAEVTKRHPGRNAGVVPIHSQNEAYIIGDLIRLDARFALLFSTPILWQSAAKLLESDLSKVVFHLSNITRKPAHIGPAIGWHRDINNTYHASVDGCTIRMLLPVQAMDVENGGTEIQPGSHLEPRSIAQTVAPIVTPLVSPGSGLVLHANVLHGGGPNRSNIDRDVIVIQFGLASSELIYSGNETLALENRDGFLRFCYEIFEQSYSVNTGQFE
jgi:hypothetical protein